MSRGTSIGLGTALIVLGLLVVAASVGGESGRDNLRLMVFGGVLAVVGLIRVMSAFSMDSRQRHQHTADPYDPRWYGGAREKQIAGRPCVECGRKITVAAEGVACDVCSEPAHSKCCEQHRSHAHRPEGIGPFR